MPSAGPRRLHRRPLKALAGVALLAAWTAGCSAPAGHQAAPASPSTSASGRTVSAYAPAGTRPVLVISSAEATPWLRLLRSGGLSAIVEDYGYLGTNSSVVVPDGTDPTAAELVELEQWVRSGGRLVTADRVVITHLGASLAPGQVASGATVTGEPAATWAAPAGVSPVEAPAGPSTVLARSDRGADLAVAWPVGRGQVLGLGIDPLGAGRSGYELMPQLARMVEEVTAAPPGPTRTGLELYLDPGTLPPSEARNFDAIADMASGARVVDVAAWDFDFTDPANDYPYQALVDALHARGVLAYAWLEPPFVTLRMWQDHPECREKSQSGKDAVVAWRDLMSLETPSCFKLAWQEWQRVLTAVQWDGVNVAELYFDQTPGRPDEYTPFSPGALALFGKPPASDPAGFAEFRTQLATTLNRQLLGQINGLPGAARLDLELTVIDSLLDPAKAQQLANDDTALAQVARQEGASLEIEDPYTTWQQGPLRYDRVTSELPSLVSPGNGVIDVNVVDRPGARPTATMTGGELDLAAESAAAFDGRLAVYSLGTVGTDDMAALPAAMAGSASTTYDGVVAPWTVAVHAPPGRADSEAQVDGVQWPTEGGTAIVPAGQHSVTWSGGPPAGPGLARFTGELSQAAVRPAQMTLGYGSRAAVYAVVTARPAAETVDGSSQPVAAVSDPAGGWAVRLPAGTHQVVLNF